MSAPLTPPLTPPRTPISEHGVRPTSVFFLQGKKANKDFRSALALHRQNAQENLETLVPKDSQENDSQEHTQPDLDEEEGHDDVILKSSFIGSTQSRDCPGCNPARRCGPVLHDLLVPNNAPRREHQQRQGLPDRRVHQDSQYDLCPRSQGNN